MADAEGDFFCELIAEGDHHDPRGRVMGKKPSRQANRSQKCFEMAWRQIDNEPLDLPIGKKFELVTKVIDVGLFAEFFSVVIVIKGFAHERRKVSLNLQASG